MSIAILSDGVLSGNIERYFWLRVMGHHPAADCIENMIHCLQACGIDKVEDWKTRRFSFLHAAGPERLDPKRDGRRMFENTPSDSHQDILGLIPLDDEEV